MGARRNPFPKRGDYQAGGDTPRLQVGHISRGPSAFCRPPDAALPWVGAHQAKERQPAKQGVRASRGSSVQTWNLRVSTVNRVNRAKPSRKKAMDTDPE